MKKEKLTWKDYLCWTLIVLVCASILTLIAAPIFNSYNKESVTYTVTEKRPITDVVRGKHHSVITLTQLALRDKQGTYYLEDVAYDTWFKKEVGDTVTFKEDNPIYYLIVIWAYVILSVSAISLVILITGATKKE
jgi:hypothetical protein